FRSAGAWIFGILDGLQAYVDDIAIDFQPPNPVVFAAVLTNAPPFAIGIYRHAGTGGWVKRDACVPNPQAPTQICNIVDHPMKLRLALTTPRGDRTGDPNDPPDEILYLRKANIDAVGALGIFKTTNSGATWSPLPLKIGVGGTDDIDNNRPRFTFVLEIDPDDPDVVYTGALFLYRFLPTLNAWQSIGGGLHGDEHALTFDPTTLGILYAGDDGGVFRGSAD